MANDLNNGAEKLVERILADARAEAEQAAAAAQAETEKIKELAVHDVQEAEQGFEARAKKAAEDILERSRTNAELDSRKYALRSKRAVMDEAFKAALDGLNALSGERRDGLLVALARENAMGGEAIAPAAADEARIKALLGDINAAVTADGRAPLTLGEKAASIGGGFLLLGKGYEMNCSFEAMLGDVREAEESSVAKILFG